MIATGAKVLEVTPDEYHLRPGLSSSIACTLITQSPLHAWQEHPCFGGALAGDEDDPGDEATPAMEFGTVGHALVLGKGQQYVSLPFKDWRTKDAKAARDAARAAGQVPLKTKDFERAQAAAAKVIEQLGLRGFKLDGQSELAIEWYEESPSGPVLCRAMLDHVWLDRGFVLDLKFTKDAAPSAIERSAENLGYAIQHAAYTRALAALRPELAGRIEMMFAFVETKAPFAVNPAKPDGVFRELGERRWRRAVETWGACLINKKWPGYDGAGINTLSAPPWALAREEQAA